jgi:hypothetical protein
MEPDMTDNRIVRFTVGMSVWLLAHLFCTKAFGWSLRDTAIVEAMVWGLTCVVLARKGGDQ